MYNPIYERFYAKNQKLEFLHNQNWEIRLERQANETLPIIIPIKISIAKMPDTEKRLHYFWRQEHRNNV